MDPIIDSLKKKEAHFKSFEKNFTERLYQLIKDRHRILVSAANAELIVFFWKMGKEINYVFTSDPQTQDTNIIIDKISSDLVMEYGDFFSKKSLRSSVLFYQWLPDFTVIDTWKYSLSWEHILILLELGDKGTRQFYLTLSVEQGLTIPLLKTQIAAAVHKLPAQDASPTQKRKPDRRQRLQSNYAGANPFLEPLRLSFRALTDPSNNKAGTLNSKVKQRVNPDSTLTTKIVIHINQYRSQQNRLLNANMNMAFWEIGREINVQSTLNEEKPDLNALIRTTSRELKKKFGIKITQRWLRQMTGFAEQFKDGQIILPVTYLLTWKHILALLSLNSIENIFYYLDILAVKKMSATSLRKLTKSNAHVQPASITERSPQTGAFARLYKTTPSSEVKGRATTRITTIDINIDNLPQGYTGQRLFSDRQMFEFLTLF